MNKVLLSFALACSMLQARSQEGHHIQIALKPYTSGKVYLGYYYSKSKALADSTMLDATGKGVFAGKDTLHGGVYFIVSPSKVILFDLLIDKDEHFSISADTSNLPASIQFTGSPDNLLFQDYTRFTNEKGAGITAAQKELKTGHPSKIDSLRLTEKIRKLDADIQQYRKEVIAKHPSSLLATLFYVLKEP